ncbi:RNA ligase-domain-containing protein [Cokeromyces recurvatus]|uniref:RNA ligase-domain-containing protein n=1 Tax=Cokeromyces recurvatus TaxID=90255 RepID=UPI00221F4E2F|nr:RNA ligase-domain-containing protein [Cokeromyces recurvatus]KAI7902359.1 RNA ligase-domain-containing protein [Cokeromyces recurvatus]
MSNIDIPIIPPDPEQTQQVIEKLYKLKDASPKELRNRDFTLEDGQVWTSWTMRESVYKKKADRFPTLARGLFTKDYKVMVRGYDKFFNILESKYTQWPELEEKTEGPYEITTKENGCIIFIVALSNESIIVTSKHSIPSEKTDMKTHAGVGYAWVLKHLASVNKTEKDLASWLNNKNITLVAELCDDEFEQHILPYSGKDRGLYLHGINYNLTELNTLPSSTVKQVAIEFGFHTIDYILLDTLKEVRKFGEQMQQTQCYNDKEIEGVVIRCKKEGKDFMFKMKNDRYLQYREYREVTKHLLVYNEDHISIKEDKLPKISYQKTYDYIEWLRKRVLDKPEWFKEYKNQKGIVQVREEFEKYWETNRL